MLAHLSRRLREEALAWARQESGYEQEASKVMPTGAETRGGSAFASAFRLTVATGDAVREFTVTISESSRL